MCRPGHPDIITMEQRHFIKEMQDQRYRNHLITRGTYLLEQMPPELLWAAVQALAYLEDGAGGSDSRIVIHGGKAELKFIRDCEEQPHSGG